MADAPNERFVNKAIMAPFPGLGWKLRGYLVVAVLLQCIDAVFLTNRPRSLDPDFAETFPFSLWRDYADVDLRYHALNDPITYLFAYAGIIDAVLSVVAIVLSFSDVGRSLSLKLTALVTFLSAYRAIGYLCAERLQGYRYTKGVDSGTFQVYVLLPHVVRAALSLGVCFNVGWRLGVAEEVAFVRRKKVASQKEPAAASPEWRPKNDFKDWPKVPASPVGDGRAKKA